MILPHEALEIARKYQQAGQLPEAERMCRQLLQAEPHRADALRLLGSIACQSGRHGAAVDYLRRALHLAPDDAEIHKDLGIALQRQGALAEAATCLRRAIDRRPDLAEAHHFLGLVLMGQGNVEEAAASYRQAIAHNPGHAASHSNLGNALSRLGKPAEAVASYQQALRLKPDNATTYHNLAVVLQEQGKLEEAVARSREAIRLNPGYAFAHHNLGNILLKQGKLDEAVACYRQALRIRPNYAEAHSNLGVVLQKQDRFAEAAACYRQALALKPDHADAHNNLGVVLVKQGKLAEGLACYDEAIRLKPDYADAHWNRSMAWLLTGNYQQAWQEYEWRWPVKVATMPAFTQPLWDGAPLAGKTILLCCEQGLGDTLQFVRYAAKVKERGGTVLVACQPALTRILTGCAGVDRVISRNGPLADFDVYAPLLSLPRIFGTTLDTVPANIPYLTADADGVQRWRQVLHEPAKFKVGIAWQGDPSYPEDRYRSFPLRQLAPLARLPDVQLVSLQKGPGTEQLAKVDFPLTDLGSQLDERSGPFVDSAAVITQLDLVISADTAMAHLAGALGARVWLPLHFAPDWRWLLDRTDSPWYPQTRLFRQTEWGSWPDVFERMAGELRKLLAARRGLVTIEMAAGELLDKLTILELKAQRLTDPAKLGHVRAELAAVQTACALLGTPEGLSELLAELREVNGALWQVEDDIRCCEQAEDFGARFVELARAVYRHNDRRAALKRRINQLFDAPFMEEKEYQAYR